MQDTLSDSLHISFHEYDEEQKILQEAIVLWNKLYPISEYIAYRNIGIDTVVSKTQVIDLLEANDSIRKTFTTILSEKTTLLSKKANENIKSAFTLLSLLSKEINSLDLIYNKYISDAKQQQRIFFFITVFLVLFILGFLFFYYKNILFDPLKMVYEHVNDSFKQTKFIPIPYFHKNEVGKIAFTFNKFFKEIHLATEYILALTSNKGFSENILRIENLNTPLSNALVQMRKELRTLEEAQRKHSWSFEGQAIFAEILSKHNDNFDKLVDEIVSQFVNYLNARQGALFVEKIDDGESKMEMAACYAYDRKKYTHKKIKKGEGLIGQAWIEEETVYVKEVPQNHTSIKSGLGDAKPKSILIVPLMTHGKVFGIIEIASFKILEPYQVEFVEKVGETIASTLSAVEINNRTTHLLQESQSLTKQMKDQEEQLRTSLDELKKTQEEAQRRELQKDREQKILVEKYDNELLKYQQQEEVYQNKIESLKIEIKSESINSDKVSELKNEIEKLEEQIVDMKETIKIKDMRIDKLRKRFQDKKK